MNEQQVEELMKKYKEQLLVDEEFKHKLRKSFEKQKKQSRGFWRVSVWGMVASFFLVIYTFFQSSVPHVHANSLIIGGQYSFVDVGSDETVSMAERNGKLYLSLKEKGIFEYGIDSFKRVVDQKVDTFSWNEAGDKIVFSTGGDVGLYDFGSSKTQTILKGQWEETYGNPTWMGDDEILFEKVEGSRQESLIVQLDLSTMKETVIGPGRKPSYLERDKAILFERDKKIFTKDVKTLQEHQIDDGTDPAVSSDGEYVAYVKNEGNMQNVWISDIPSDTKKQVTKNMKNTNPELAIGAGEPIYRYRSPIWSTNSNHVYVLKQRQLGGSQVTRIDLTKSKLTAQETVAKYLQALMSREEDFARSLLVSPPVEPLTGSNPRVVGYYLLASEIDDGRTYVDAQAYWSYTAAPYYQIIESRYYLTPSENGFRISEIQQRERIEVTCSEDGNAVMQVTNGKEKLLFDTNEIPAKYLEQGDFRIASLAFDQLNKRLYFTLQHMKEENHPSHSFVTLLVYDAATKQFAKLNEIREIDGKKDVGVSNVTVDPNGQFVSLDLYHDASNDPKQVTYVYDTKKNETIDLRNALPTMQITATNGQYWENGKMAFQVESYGQNLQFEYDPKK